jgi:hypothetical protein|tara:strand:+ start:394 stop:687 length:294 start_codon:yes stop_codon:yes gene_type:complete
MQKIPTELFTHIFSYLKINELKPFDVLSDKLIRTNVVWEPRTKKTFDIVKSINHYQEYKWLLKLRKHQMAYKRQWTLGCVGRITPLKKPNWEKAIIV